MSNTDHLAKAKDYIAKGEDYYRKAGEEILKAKAEGWTNAAVAREIGIDRTTVSRLVAAATKRAHAHGPLEVDWQSGSNKRDEVAGKVMANPEQRRQVIAALPPKQLEDLIEEANDVAIERVRAKHAEHDTTPTARQLLGGVKFDPAEFWADTLVIRVNRNARELAKLIQRGGGLLFGSMDADEAFEYLHEAERLIAEARAAAQEQVRDGVQV